MTPDIFRILASHAYLEGRMFSWWRGARGWREIAAPVFLASR